MTIRVSTAGNIAAGNIAEFHRHFSSDPLAVASVIGALSDHFRQFHLQPDDFSNIEIVLSEIINNINEHAYCGATERPIEIHAALEGNRVCFRLTDRGAEMPNGCIPACKKPDQNVPPEQNVPPDQNVAIAQLPEGGFGWSLIQSIACNLRYARIDGENHLSFRVTIHCAKAPNG